MKKLALRLRPGGIAISGEQVAGEEVGGRLKARNLFAEHIGKPAAERIVDAAGAAGGDGDRLDLRNGDAGDHGRAEHAGQEPK